VSEPDEIDHDYTDDIVCPWCGKHYQDCGDWFDGGRESASHDCDECGKPFSVTREFSVTYTTEKEEKP
jgi:hypothetical protein